MADKTRLHIRVIQFLEHSWREERAGLPGHLNLVLIGLATLVVISALATEWLQAAVRIFRPTYTTGLPNVIVPLAVLFGGGILCVVFVGWLGILRDRD